MQSKNTVLLISFLTILFISFGSLANAQNEKKKHKYRIHAMYGSWGYNEEWYTRSTVHVHQAGLGNEYSLVHVHGEDHKGWDDGIFNKALTIPQYNYRLGFYINDKQDLGIELNFDHTKYIITDGQAIRVKGARNHGVIDSTVIFSGNNGFYYYLNNGANFFLFNLVKRVGLYAARSNNLRIDVTGKAGIGPVIPHVENSFFGLSNTPHFQIGGWNTGVETAIRFTIMRYAFIEFSQKVDYARYSNLKIYEGTARQSFGTYELILSAGIVIPTHKHNAMFSGHTAASGLSPRGT